ncbi:Paf1-complex subunit LEO1 PWA37_005193 [Arxiozyma heterogenica]|uniref:RNA polymerase-associated protein LEO1 n=1 Tax=Arxiozyma heterogenica TaxID=278026 RepID=A0AAN8A9K8_9SACH|nr:hypothetical protein RI543_000130 [Kazachstania heterogenica]
MSDINDKNLEMVTDDSKSSASNTFVSEPKESNSIEDVRKIEDNKEESKSTEENRISKEKGGNQHDNDDDDNDGDGDGDDIDDLFGDEEEEEDDEGDFVTGRRRNLDVDDEEEMYTRKFYGEDISNLSGQEDEDDKAHFKEQDVELVRHMVPYKVTPDNDSDKIIYYAKVPAFLMIDPIAFDPPTFEEKVKERLSNFSSREDQLGDLLIDENTVRWRYSRDSNQKVFRESNTQIVQWSDGSYSLKIGDEYSDILVNDTDNTFLAVSHDEQELMQCVDGGEVKKTLMFIPTSTNSKVHQRLSSAVARRVQRATAGPGTYLINVDPELEKNELERKQQQIIRERRRRQNKEKELLDSPDNTFGSNRNLFNKRDDSTSASLYGSKSRRSRGDEYEEDDFLVDDDEDEEFDSNQDEEEEEEEEEEDYDNDDDAAEEEEEKARAARLKESKRSESMIYADSQSEEESQKRRKVAVISDDDDE